MSDLERDLKEAKRDEERLMKELDAAKLRVELARKVVNGRSMPIAPRGM
jgi:hypothetical protein